MRGSSGITSVGMSGHVHIESSGRFTAPALPDHWHVACLSSELRNRPLGRTVLGIPMVLFRDRSGLAVALVDRCPHRNVELSAGRCVDGGLECRYHGWRFDASGRCVEVPGLEETVADRPVRRVDRFPVGERDGMVWVVPSGVEPQAGPPHLDGVGEPGYRTIHLRMDVPGPYVAAVENALDVTHTSFLHRGLFRTGKRRKPVQVTIVHGPDRVEARFEGEAVPSGLLGRALAPQGGSIEHTDRFVVPALAQVEYRLRSGAADGDDRHIVLNAFYTPVTDDSCVLHAAAAYRLPVPVAVARAALVPLARIVLRQDVDILANQRANVTRFGGERFVNTTIDVLGPPIVRLLRRHERGEASAEPQAADDVVTMLI